MCKYMYEGNPSEARMVEGEIYMACELRSIYGKDCTFLGTRFREVTRIPCNYEGENEKECPLYIEKEGTK